MNPEFEPVYGVALNLSFGRRNEQTLTPTLSTKNLGEGQNYSKLYVKQHYIFITESVEIRSSNTKVGNAFCVKAL